MSEQNKINAVKGRRYRAVSDRVFGKLPGSFKRIHGAVNRRLEKADKKAASAAREELACSVPTQNDTILFITYQGGYTCNPRAIADEVIRQKLPYKIYWVIKNDTDKEGLPPEIIPLKRGTYKFYEKAASARVLVDNTHNLARLGVYLKDDQYLLQTWHGSLGIKRLDGDIVKDKSWEERAAYAQAYTSYLISNSDFETEVFRTSYWPGVPHLDYGHARNDILFAAEEKQTKIRSKVLKACGIPTGVRTFLYAPTHKDNVNESFFEPDYAGIKRALEKRFGDEWVILLRFHSRLKAKHFEWVHDLPSYVYDVTSYDDMQDVMLATDVGATDYSSWIFDYILLRRPGFILADDVETFEQNRSFYYPLESTPFPIASDNNGLIANIEAFDAQKYADDVESFLKIRGCFEDGHASERIVEKIKELML